MTATNTIPLTWNTFVQNLAGLAVVGTTTVNNVVQGVDDWFNILLPQACQYAEMRISRDLDLVQHQVERSFTLTGGSNKLALSSNDFVVVDDVFVTFGGQIYPLLPVSKEFLQNVYGSSTGAGIPQCFAVYGGDLATAGNTSLTLTLGPWPDQNYATTVVGAIRAPSLYSFASNGPAATSTTYISTYLPDLMLQAAMIPVSEYQRNFVAAGGQMGSDPLMGFSYESQYQTLLAGAKGEAFRNRQEASAWTSEAQPPAATPAR